MATKAQLRRTILERAGREALVLDDGQLHLLDRMLDALAPGGRGLYVWGPPGRGKSWLAAAVIEAAAEAGAGPAARRVHFHAFFRDLHAKVFAARTAAGRTAERSAFAQALDELLGEVRVLCFDEFHVGDPADGMFVTRLLEQLRARRITLLATSNYPPQDLLPDPLFHHLMEPAIRALTADLEVVALDAGTDYRTLPAARRTGFAAGWHLPEPDAGALEAAGLARPSAAEHATLRPGTRALEAQRAGDQLWFRFEDLCLAPSAPSDYLLLAGQYRHWVLDDVPSARTDNPDGWKRFGNLVDVLYDAGCRLDLLGLPDLGDDAPGAGHPTDLARIRSRLGALRQPAEAMRA